MPTVFLADDHKIFRQGLRLLLSSLEGIEVVGEAGAGDEALNQISALLPDIAILDIAMPKLDGLEVLKQLREKTVPTKIIILTMHKDEKVLRKALFCGASGFVLKDNAFEDLAYAIQTALSGGVFVSPVLTDKLIWDGLKDKVILLSDREKEVLKLIASGFTNKEIANRLNISIKTVETHRSRLMEKLNIHKLSELVIYAVRSGIVT